MNLWHKFIIRCLPFDSMEEYNGALEYHKQEIKIYRKQWQYIVGVILFFLPAIFFLITGKNWLYRFGIIAMIFGLAFITDTISEHYCSKLYKDRGPIAVRTSSNHTTGKKLILSRFCLLAQGYVIFLVLVGMAIEHLFHLSGESGFFGGIFGGGMVLGTAIFRHFSKMGKMNWFFKDSQNQ